MADSPMPGSVLLLGATDVTLAVAEAVLACGARLAGIVTTGDSFSISYSAGPVQNARAVNLSEWGRRSGVGIVGFSNYDQLLADIAASQPDICLVAGWYHMVPRRFRDAFQRGCFGFHASLLPLLRGGAPLNWAILTAETQTGVTLFEMDDGVDDGLIFGQSRFAVPPRASVGDLILKARDACAELTRDTLPGLLAGTAPGRKQLGRASYGMQRVPEDGRVDWRMTAVAIDRLVRAVSRPYPGAFTTLGDDIVRIWTTEPYVSAPAVFGAPGQIARLPETRHPCVVTGDGLLQIVEATDAQGGDYIDKLRKSGHKRFTF